MSQGADVRAPGVVLLERLIDEGLNGHDEAVVDELFSPRYRDHHPLTVPGADRTAGRMGSTQNMRAVIAFLAGQADVKFTVEDAFAAGDRVGYRLFGEGLVRIPRPPGGPPAPPGGAPDGATVHLTYRCVGIFALAAGRFVERWGPIVVG